MPCLVVMLPPRAVLCAAVVLGIGAPLVTLNPNIGGDIYPGWQQFFPFKKWASYEEQIHGRPTRVRSGNGRYTLLPVGAELMCDFPQSLVIVSNIVWERADLGDRSSLNQLYQFHGLPHEFSVLTRPYGSTLHLFQVTPLDRGVYRCMVSAVDPSSSYTKPITFFQDVEFFPEVQ